MTRQSVWTRGFSPCGSSQLQNGISSYEFAKHLGATQKMTWFLDHRIRLAMRAKSFDPKSCGGIEATKPSKELGQEFVHEFVDHMSLC